MHQLFLHGRLFPLRSLLRRGLHVPGHGFRLGRVLVLLAGNLLVPGLSLLFVLLLLVLFAHIHSTRPEFWESGQRYGNGSAGFKGRRGGSEQLTVNS